MYRHLLETFAVQYPDARLTLPERVDCEGVIEGELIWRSQSVWVWVESRFNLDQLRLAFATEAMLTLRLLESNRLTQRSISALSPSSCTMNIVTGRALGEVEREIVGSESDVERLVCLMTDTPVL